MQLKVAAFGKQAWIERLNHYVRNDDELEVVPFAFTSASETTSLIEEAFMCDINLFMGPLAYLYAKETIDKKRLPAIQVDVDEYMILTSLYRMKNHHGQKLDRLSIDVPDREYVSSVLEELHIRDRDIYTYSFQRDVPIDPQHIAGQHRKRWREGKIDYILTSIAEVEQDLSASGIPAFLMEVPKRNILEAVKKAKSLIHFNKSKSAQIVAGYVRIKEYNISGEHNKQDTLLKMHQLLLQFARRTYSSVLESSNDQFVLFGTRGILDHITNHYRDFPLLADIENSLEVTVDIGFGLGMTPRQAADHAVLALETCRGYYGSSCYIVNERQDTIGPLGVEKQFDASRLYQALIHQARLNNELSYNFIDFIKLRNNEPFSSADIATYYRVTKRSAERTINKLLSGEVIKAVGHEKPYVQGRPRKLFTINM